MANSKMPGYPGFEPVVLKRTVPENLAAYVRDITGFYENGQTPVVRKELPITFIPLILILGEGYTEHTAINGPSIRSLDRSFIGGLSGKPAMIGTQGWSLCIQVNFTPVGAWKFLQLDLKELAGQMVELSDLGKELHNFDNRLLELRNWPDRFDLLESVLQQRLLGSPDSDPRVQAALELITDSQGKIKIQTMFKLGNISTIESCRNGLPSYLTFQKQE